MAREQRRLAAIMVADVVGYSKLVGSDEAGTLAQLQALQADVIQPIVAEHAGRLFKAVGDGFLVEFASAVQAVRAARAIQQANDGRNLSLRIGIHLGDVVVQGDDLMGDGVNIAARIEGIGEPGGVAISRQVHDHVRDKLDLTYTDKGEVTLKNIARPVHVYTVAAAARASAATPATLALPDRPSIAVLPFQNMSGDVEQEYFCDGVVEEIITALSRIRWLFVIARNSTFMYKGKSVDVKQVGQEFGVRYVLEGSVRKGGNRVRVTAQLIDALAGTHLWAERYDRELSDIFAVQDEITSSVCAVIEPTLAEAERNRAIHRPPESLDAWEAYQKGLWHFYKYTVQENGIAQANFRRAIELDASFAPGHYGYALTLKFDLWLYSTLSWADVAGKGLEEARLAVSLDDRDSLAHAVLASTLQLCGEWELAIEEGRTAVMLNPNSVWSMWAMGVSLGWGGYHREGIDYLRQAMRASPRDPLTRLWTFWTGIFWYFLRQYDKSIECMRQVLQGNATLDAYALRWLGKSHAQMGQLDKARSELERARAISPVFMDRFLRERPPWMKPTDYALAIEGLQKAGWTAYSEST